MNNALYKCSTSTLTIHLNIDLSPQHSDGLLQHTDVPPCFCEVRNVGLYLAAFTGDAAVVVPSGLVPTHHTGLILLQVAGDVPCNRDTKSYRRGEKGGGRGRGQVWGREEVGTSGGEGV